MKVADKAALAVGAVGTWIYIGGVDSDLWGRAALGAGHWKDEGASRGRMVVQKDCRRNELQRSDGLEFL